MGRGGRDIGKRPDKIVRETAPLPQEPIGSERAAVGVVKWWDDARGYGAVASEETEPWDIWCHFSHIAAKGFRALQPGQRVEVEFMRVDQGTFKYVASRVRSMDRA